MHLYVIVYRYGYCSISSKLVNALLQLDTVRVDIDCVLICSNLFLCVLYFINNTNLCTLPGPTMHPYTITTCTLLVLPNDLYDFSLGSTTLNIQLLFECIIVCISGILCVQSEVLLQLIYHVCIL